MECRELYAHTPREGTEVWQSLEDHLNNVAKLTSCFADAFGHNATGMYVGLLHDLGKALPEFQDYLKQCYKAMQLGEKPPRAKIDHKLAGAYYTARCNGPEGFLAIPLAGHHGGMSNPSDLLGKLNDQAAIRRITPIIENTLPLIANALHSPSISPDANNPLSFEMLLRMIFSCLVDADYLDTEHHWEPEKTKLRMPGTKITDLWKLFKDRQKDMLDRSEGTPINGIRREIYEACIESAELEPGVFRLTVPTGGGKTRSGMAFALKHAAKYKLSRIIVAIPYTSIIDQNAQVYRDILGSENVLEHHSAIEPPEDDESEEYQRARLASENWDMPVVVTTTVQLFESLFSNKPSKCRKLHNLARSVIILDEVQTLPIKMLQPIVSVLDDLVHHYGVTLVLCTATQPALTKQNSQLYGLGDATDIISDAQSYFDKLERVSFEVAEKPMSWSAVASELRPMEQALCVVNSKKDALALWHKLADKDAIYLSTHLCAAHRQKILSTLKQRLKKKRALIVSTQLIECGCDLDLPVVYRALGPLDRIIQAAGRCNREGKLPTLGHVKVFIPEEGSAPSGVYQLEMATASDIIKKFGSRLSEIEIIERYFSRLYSSAKRSGLDAYNINQLRKAKLYEKVEREARIIREDTVSALVKYESEVYFNTLRLISEHSYLTQDEWRMIQRHTISLRRYDLKRLSEAGLIKETECGLCIWLGKYDDVLGIGEEVIDPNDLMC